jgi:hypothetical protein
MIGRSRRFKPAGEGGVWDWDDPTIADDFVGQIETEVLSLLRSLDSIERIVAYILSQEMRGYSFNKDQSGCASQTQHSVNLRLPGSIGT